MRSGLRCRRRTIAPCTSQFSSLQSGLSAALRCDRTGNSVRPERPELVSRRANLLCELRDNELRETVDRSRDAHRSDNALSNSDRRCNGSNARLSILECDSPASLLRFIECRREGLLGRNNPRAADF